jgi:hypothetical protein
MALSLCLQPGFGYSKRSVFTADDCLTPHLEMETCVAVHGSKMLLYISMDPRLSLVRWNMCGSLASAIVLHSRCMPHVAGPLQVAQPCTATCQ